jgi:3-oxoacyl-[acyl-carrier protein] reductase
LSLPQANTQKKSIVRVERLRNHAHRATDEARMNTHRLHGKVAIVTGGASGFGAGIAARFVEEGARVVVADINDSAAHRTRQQLGAALALSVDVTSCVAVKAMVEASVREFGRVDILVNNAGITHLPAPAAEVSEADFERVFAVNVKSIYNAVRAIVPVYATQGGGVIINVGSVGATRPRPGLVWYGASKGAVATATKGLAAELAPLKIRVNNIAPSVGDTPLLADFVGHAPDRNLPRLLDTIPLGRLATPADVASAALYLASDEASFVTGIDLGVDGGRNI